MKFNCNKCGTEILSENINISTNLAKCQNCNSIFKINELIEVVEKKDFKPPQGTSIIINKGINNELEIKMPANGFSVYLIPQLLFSIFWLGFITFWTSMALKGSIFFALFSIPFWIIGVLMFVGIFNSIFEKQIIKLDKYTLKINKLKLINSLDLEIDIRNIISIEMKDYVYNTFSIYSNPRMIFRLKGNGSIKYPAVISGSKTTYFFENANEVEQEWITKLLNKIVKQINKK